MFKLLCMYVRYMYVQNFHSLYFSTLPSVSNVTLCMRQCTITVKGWNNSSLHDFKVLIHILKRNHVKVGKSVRKVRKRKNKEKRWWSQIECPTRALKAWKLEPELEISSSSQVRFNHYQFQVFKFKTWRTRNFQVKSSLKSYKLELEIHKN